MTTKIIEDLYALVWNQNDMGLVDRIVAPEYTIHSDPGDNWDGKTLNRETYKQRVQCSRKAFPDLKFEIKALIGQGDLVSVRWEAIGTQLGDIGNLKATGKKLSFHGQTIYEVKKILVSGHWQVIDRLGFIEQLRP